MVKDGLVTDLLFSFTRFSSTNPVSFLLQLKEFAFLTCSRLPNSETLDMGRQLLLKSVSNQSFVHL